jgi:SAM-dependent methyltransferase
MHQLFCELPESIDQILFKEFSAKYQRGGNFDLNLSNDELQNQIYLGTYFPRSYSESYQLFTELFRNEPVLRSVQRKAALNILDIGTGTGGNVLGMMQAIVEKGLPTKAITIYSIEGNEMASDVFRKIVARFNAIYKTGFVLQQEKIIFSAENLKRQMSDYLYIKGIKFDFITTSKFVGEFYNVAMPKELKLYRNLTESVSPFLQPNGIYLLLDVVAGSRDRSCDFKTIIMSNELNAYIKSQSNTLSYIYPFPCACWSSVCQVARCYIEKCFSVSHSHNQCDESKVTYRIMAPKEFAKTIVGARKVQERYPIGKAKYCMNGKVSVH